MHNGSNFAREWFNLVVETAELGNTTTLTDYWRCEDGHAQIPDPADCWNAKS
jgi:hypothetical protein